MDVLDRICTKKIVRQFSPEPVGRDALLAIIRAGTCAPTAFGNRPWRFVLVREGQMRRQILGLAGGSHVVEASAALIVVFADYGAMCHFTLDYQAIGACLQNMFLAADSFDLGAVWLGEALARAEEVRLQLELPETLELMAVVAIGQPGRSIRSCRRGTLQKAMLREI